MTKAMICLLLCTRILFPFLAESSIRSAQTQIPTNQWAVKLSPGVDPDITAKSLNAANKGPIAHLPDMYLFETSEPIPLTETIRLRAKKTDIVWIQQQIKRWRFLRKVPSFEDPFFSDQWHLSNTGQHGGTVNADAHILPAWEKGVSGEGIVIGIVDDGLQHEHPDLQPNYVSAWSYDFNDNDSDPSPFIGFLNDDPHGTSVAGVAAARENNDTCGVGAAYRASLSGLRLLANEVSDADEAKALSYMRDHIHIYNNSWGPSDGDGPEGPDHLTMSAIEDNIHQGRNGLGNIYVFAAGNGLLFEDNVNLDGYANLRYVIAVSAVNQYDKQSYYSEPGACILVCAPSEGRDIGIYTSDLMGRAGYDPSGDCTGTFGGTSSAAPLVSGIIALILEQNPNLTWRDVQHILLKSTQKNDPNDSDWSVNADGRPINHKYGFGRVHAGNAVKLAANWRSVSDELSIETTNMQVHQNIPDNTRSPLIVNTTIIADLTVEHVAVILTANHDCAQQLEITLISPAGTRSSLVERQTSPNFTYNNWRFTSVRHWGESSDGQWQLEIYDKGSGCSGKLSEWQLLIYGESQSQQVNQMPIAETDMIYAVKNETIRIDPLANDLDADLDSLELVSVSQPVHGKVISQTDKLLTYVPDKDFNGLEQLTYTVSDQQTTVSGIIRIHVLDQVSETNNTEKFIPDNDPLGMISEILIPSGGTIETIDIHIKMTHNNFSDISAYLISPNQETILLFANLNTFQNEIDIHFTNDSKNQLASSPYIGIYQPAGSLDPIEQSIATGNWSLMIIDHAAGNTGKLDSWGISIIHTPIENAPPASRPDQYQVNPSNSICLNVLENDTDPNGQSLHIKSIEQPLHGAAEIKDCGIYYHPQHGFTGIDNLTYIVRNEAEETASEAVEIIVADDLALSFDGINDALFCGMPPALNIQNQMTIELWIYPTNYGERNVQGFGRLIDREHYLLFLNETGREDYADYSLMFAIENSWGIMYMGNTPKNSIRLNEWQHIAATYDSQSGSMTIYINAQKQQLTYPFGRPSDSIRSTQGNPFIIGESNNMDRAFQGMMDDIRIWNIIRSEIDIQLNMDNILTSIPQGLVAYWPMQSKQTFLQDIGPNQLHCRIHSPSWVPGLMVTDSPNIWSENDTIYTAMNAPITFDPLTNDFLDETPKSLEVSPYDSQTSGQMNVLSNFTVRYVPDHNFIGIDTYQYTITSQLNDYSSALLKINVVSDFSLYYDDRLDYVNAGISNRWQLDGPITIAAWIKPKNTSTQNQPQQDYIFDTTAFSIFINLQENSNFDDHSLVYWREQQDDWGAGTLNTQAHSIEWDQWQHIAVVDDNDGNIKIYINGIKMPVQTNGSVTKQRAFQSGNPVILGNASDLQHGFQGWLDEIYIWSETRTQLEIQQMMYGCFPGQSKNLLAYWPITDNQVIDHSIYELHDVAYGITFQTGVLPRYPVSLPTIISGLTMMSNMTTQPICVDDIYKDLVFGFPEILLLMHMNR